ncbi:proteasome adapter and scaffold protein ecm29 [Quercus suber]|uniref:Proteasome adapter and scaffold protein ecm29 n=1 Tax=Quercus suber TaxID=58331 RepID=A0AAW0M1X0_QUESU
MVRNFCIVYIEMAFERVQAKQKEELAPMLLVNISKLPLQHQEIILRIATKVIGECHSSQIDDEVTAKYRSINDSQDRELFIEFCLHTVLYQPPSQSGGCPPGLSIAQANRVSGKHQLKSDMLLMTKLGILNVIEAMEFAPELVYPIYVAACVDWQEPVVKRGEELLKKKGSGANLENPNLINKLFILFNGNVGAENVEPDLRVNPGNPALKSRLMSIFCHSVMAANSFPSTLQCIFGCIYGNGTTSRLKQLGMEFTVWVFKHAKFDQLKLIGPVILTGILKSLDSYSDSKSDATARDTKTFAFQAIGLLAQRMPQLFSGKIDMALRLFDALKVEDQSLRFIVQEATNSLAAAYKEAPATVLRDLETLLLKSSQEEKSEVRFCALRWATSLYDMQHCPSRFICILGTADSKLDIREMALEGLFPVKDEGRIITQSLDLRYPKLGVMLDYILKQQPKLLESNETREHKLLFPPKTYVAMIKFLLKCFESELELNNSLEGSSEFQSSVEAMCLLLEHAMSFEGSVELHANASKALIDIACHFPKMIASHYALKLSWLKALLSHVDLDTRESVARLLGIASSALPMPAASAFIHELIASISGTHKLRFETQHGALCAIGYITADCMSRTPTIPETLFQTTLKCLVDVVVSETATLASIAMQALGHIGLRVSLPPLINDSSSGEVSVHLLKPHGLLLLYWTCYIFTAILEVEDILFAAGEALSFLWGGVPVTADAILKTNYTSLSMFSNFLTGDVTSSLAKYGPVEKGKVNDDCHALVRDAITRKLFDVLLYSTRKEERCSGTVWLLSLTMYAGHHPAIQKMLPEIQEAFSHLLGEQNELTQELASHGMSIVYEIGDAAMKENLVNALVSTLTGSGKRKRAIKLVEDSEVFQEGTIGENLSGGKLSTYKELCSLANEMGQPDLIYKFMDLANYQASLNSKRVDILTVLHEKLRKLLSGDDIKAIQKIVISIGHICVKETASSHLNIALDLIFSLSRSKVEDILFAAGEALSFLWGGVPVTADAILKTNYTSLSMFSNFLTGDVTSSLAKYGPVEKGKVNDDCHALVRDAITRKLFDVLLYSTRKEERCSGTVWLLSLTMYAGHHPAIQKMLPEIQEAFSHLLGEQNELTQELASHGMSIVYEIGDAAMKENLVNALVSTLTGSGKRKRAIKLVEDSEVFQEGTIGENLSGGKLSTYKELCSLANEMGQPDLIYKFMDLANYQASLNSKRGAAFGFSKIAKQAGDALTPYLRSLIPRLVRYQYDPDKNVQDAMAHIWKSLVTDSKKTIDENLDLIIDDLLIQCGSRLWRSREASCLALADIIQGRKFDQVGKHLKKLWSAAFRAMDDIKETVRTSGDKLCRSVTSLSKRLCDASLTEISDASQAMNIVLPFLLVEGILSKVDSIRKASIEVVTKLAKGAGIAVRPHLSDLVCCMLESLSSLEDQGLNYVELHAANVGIQTEKLEHLRISIAKGSPMWETLDICIKVVDTESLDPLVPRLAQLVRSGVGLNTRVGVASFITLLVQNVGADIRPHTIMLLRLLFPVVMEEKSVAAKRAFANACAIVLKHATPLQAQKLIEETAALHTGDRNAQISCAILLKSYSSMASDVVSGYHAAIVPVIFLSRFEDDKYISGLFEELWEDNTSGERITLQLYLGEIVSLICESITLSSWANKRKSALAICKLSEVLGESMSSYYQILLQSLMKEVPGRLWEGKDALLNALGALSASCHAAISTGDPASPNAILSLVSSACTKKVKKYREAAFSCLEQVIKAFGLPEFFNLVFPLLFDMCNMAALNKSGQAPLASDAAKTESEATEDVSVPHEKILDCMTSCIHVAHINDILEQKKNLLHIFITSLSPGSPWTVKTSAFSSIKELCSRLNKASVDFQGTSLHANITSLVQELFHSVSPEVVQCISTVKIAQVHITASECLLEITKLFGDLPLAHLVDVGFKNEILNQLGVEKNGEARIMKRCAVETNHVCLLLVHITASECLLEITKLFGDLPLAHLVDVGFKNEILNQLGVEKNGEARSLLKRCIDILENLKIENVQ